MDNPSIGDANTVLRVLKGERLKYTVRVHFCDGKITEFQSAGAPELKFFEPDRSLWLFACKVEYNDKVPCMRWPDGAILLCEENPTT